MSSYSWIIPSDNPCTFQAFECFFSYTEIQWVLHLQIWSTTATKKVNDINRHRWQLRKQRPRQSLPLSLQSIYHYTIIYPTFGRCSCSLHDAVRNQIQQLHFWNDTLLLATVRSATTLAKKRFNLIMAHLVACPNITQQKLNSSDGNSWLPTTGLFGCCADNVIAEASWQFTWVAVIERETRRKK